MLEKGNNSNISGSKSCTFNDLQISIWFQESTQVLRNSQFKFIRVNKKHFSEISKSKRSIPPSKRVWSNCQNIHAKLWGVFAVSKLFDKAFYVIKDNYSLKLPLPTSDTIYESIYGNKQAFTVLRNSLFQNVNG